jgi:hypothetical protein
MPKPGTADYSQPIDVLYAAHERLRRGCGAVRAFCEDPDLWSRTDYAAPLYRYFAHELPLVMADEEEGLMPALGRHLRGDPCFEEILGRVMMEHERDRQLGPDFLRALGTLARGGRILDGCRFSTRGLALARTTEAHSAFEEREVLPLARRFLDPRDHRALAESMRRRRSARASAAEPAALYAPR